MPAQPAVDGPPDIPEQAAAQAHVNGGSPPPPHRIRRTRMGGLWVAAALFAVVLLLLLIFILENGQKITITFLGATGHLPLGVALLLGAVLGVLLVVIPGTGRIIQLRITARRHGRADVRTTEPPAQRPHEGLPGQP
jgi:uncharacterized integral membrane protein